MQIQSKYQHILEKVTTTQHHLPKIFCDMDDVLVDFSGHIQDRWGKPINSFKDWKQDIPKIDKYWENIPPRHDAEQLVQFIKRYDLYILTAFAGWDIRSKEAKIYWCTKNFKIPANRVLPVERAQKREYALYQGRPQILIDDYSKNIIEWKAAGGIGIVHTSADTTIRQLKTLGFS